MTTDDVKRLEACWDVLGDVKNAEQHDFAGSYMLAVRIVNKKDAPKKLVAEAGKAKNAVEELVAAHLKSMELPSDLSKAKAESLAHLVYFTRRFRGVPACDDYIKSIAKVLDKQRQVAVKNLKKYFPALRKGDYGDAFKHGVAALEKGPLWAECHDREFCKKLGEWRGKAKALKISKKQIAAYDKNAKPFLDALTSSWKTFAKINAKKGKW